MNQFDIELNRKPFQTPENPSKRLKISNPPHSSNQHTPEPLNHNLRPLLLNPKNIIHKPTPQLPQPIRPLDNFLLQRLKARRQRPKIDIQALVAHHLAQRRRHHLVGVAGDDQDLGRRDGGVKRFGRVRRVRGSVGRVVVWEERHAERGEGVAGRGRGGRGEGEEIDGGGVARCERGRGGVEGLHEGDGGLGGFGVVGG